MKGDWVRCFEMRLVNSPVHEAKWLLLMAARKVDLTRLKAAAWKYWASSHLVMYWRRMPFDWFVWESVDDC